VTHAAPETIVAATKAERPKAAKAQVAGVGPRDIFKEERLSHEAQRILEYGGGGEWCSPPEPGG
jgi:hypothetical protein